MQSLELNLSSTESIIQEEHRNVVIPVIISIMYPKLFSSRGLKHKNQIDVNRNIVYSFFQGLREKELLILLELLFQDNQIPLYFLSEESYSDFSEIAKVNTMIINNFLNNLKNMVDKLGKQLNPYLNGIFNICLSILALC